MIECIELIDIFNMSLLYKDRFMGESLFRTSREPTFIWSAWNMILITDWFELQ